MALGSGKGMLATAILGAIAARNRAALEEARQRREDQDFSMKLAAERAHQENARQQTQMQALNNQRLYEREQRTTAERQQAAADRARKEFLSPLDTYTKSRERGVPEATAPMAASASQWVDYAPEYAKPGNPMHDTLDSQLQSDMEPMAKRASEIAQANLDAEKAKKAIGPPRAPGKAAGPAGPGKAPNPKELDKFSAHISFIRSLDSLNDNFNRLSSHPSFARFKLNDALSYIGAQDPELANLSAQVKEMVSERVKTLSGLAASDQERRFIEKQVPNETDTLASLRTKSDRLRKAAGWLAAEEIRKLAASSRADVSGVQREYGFNYKDPQYAVPRWDQDYLGGLGGGSNPPGWKGK